MQQTLNFETKSFYNSIPLQGQELKEATESAESQERIIELLFKCNPMNEFTPTVVMEILDFRCINSVRRCFTNLKKKGVIRKTGTYSIGLFGKKNNNWKLDQDS